VRKGESPILPGDVTEEEGLSSLRRSFLYHLELGGGETIGHHLAPLTCGLGERALEPRGTAASDYP
jgi:hypothetical protein